ncbi:MAG: CDP-diacylglycerol--glycerol-3-phosphate 3-phosphatidyltransferase [Candidatus Tectomicrobia bacterium]|uniref:CDP-diacylglycerol--glycerol-3-phosphate 3-phosphatidyltransferase n=1 Tax=Tectimicrobiota bacterium TaxID=2528274 RepID=A0A932MRF4_UNCTE|nr:CDP-diacylglycerol--glycerol-3-phosphate 3-phosphatidyltransferase [Candidatus Tectomicrobia bacterium]
MNVSNRLTLARILMLPLLVLFLVEGSNFSRTVAAALFGAAAFTDWLDGHLARARGQVTPLGEILDPVADKLLMVAALLPLVALGEVGSWIVGIILGREFLVTALRAVALRHGKVVPASRLGKWKMGLQTAAVLFLILEVLPPAGTILIWAAMAVAVVSGVDYFRKLLQEFT